MRLKDRLVAINTAFLGCVGGGVREVDCSGSLLLNVSTTVLVFLYFSVLLRPTAWPSPPYALRCVILRTRSTSTSRLILPIRCTEVVVVVGVRVSVFCALIEWVMMAGAFTIS